MGGRYEKYLLMPSPLASLVMPMLSAISARLAHNTLPLAIFKRQVGLHQDDIESLQQHLYPAVERRWLESIDQNHQAGIGHDIYLKLWALSEPNIPTDYVLFDEAQMLTHSCWVFYYVKKHTSDLCR